jgi:isocitrate dehydrogenase (NAD+)
MTKSPHQFDVLVMPNLYGSILTSIGAGLVGGAGLSPGAAFGSEFRLFEQATRKTGKTLAGKNEANPTALLFSGVNMLSCMGHQHFAKVIQTAMMNVYHEGKTLTKDVGGNATTEQFTNRII